MNNRSKNPRACMNNLLNLESLVFTLLYRIPIPLRKTRYYDRYVVFPSGLFRTVFIFFFLCSRILTYYLIILIILFKLHFCVIFYSFVAFLTVSSSFDLSTFQHIHLNHELIMRVNSFMNFIFRKPPPV